MRSRSLFIVCIAALAGAVAAEEAPCKYEIKPNDSAFALSDRFGFDLDALAAVNDRLDLSLIKVGDLLSLPCPGNATTGASLLDLISRRADLGTLFAAVRAAGEDFVKELNDTSFKGTLFAPTDKAFGEALAALELNATDLLADKPLLGELLSYHVVPELSATLADLKNGRNLTTLSGDSILVSKAKDVLRLVTSSGQKIRVDEATADLEAGAGAILHVINSVLVPEADSPGARPADECTHVVQSGEILFDLAQQYGTSVETLVKINKLSNQNVQIGRELILYESCLEDTA